MNLSHITITPAIWQNRLDKANAQAEAQHNLEQSHKAEAERVAFTLKTLEEYVAEQVANIETSYAKQIEEEELESVRNDPVQYGRLMKALTDPVLRQELAEMIDAA